MVSLNRLFEMGYTQDNNSLVIRKRNVESDPRSGNATCSAAVLKSIDSLLAVCACDILNEAKMQNKGTGKAEMHEESLANTLISF